MKHPLRILLATVWLFFFSLLGVEDLVAQDTPMIYLEWVEDPQRTIVINWIGDSGSSTSLEFRKQGGSWSTRSAARNSIPGTSRERYKVELNGLDPGSVYQFRVPGNSSTHSFRTAPSSIEDPMQFIVAGDIYTDSNEYKNDTRDTFIRMAGNVENHDPYFAALGGDLSHAGSDPDRVDLWFEFLDLWQDHMRTSGGHMIPMVISIGNNEVPGSFGADPEDLVFINALFSFPKDQWGSSFNHYGILDFGDYLSVVMLNTNHSNQIEGAQTSWLSNQLSNRRNVDHVFPVYHVAGWPTEVNRTFRGIHEDAVRNNWHPVFRNNDIRVVFEHHDHLYKKTRPIGNCSVPINSQSDCSFSSDGVIYMGGGSWGSPNVERTVEKRWYHDKVAKEHNFVLVEITHYYREITSIQENNSQLDRFQQYIALPTPVAEEATERSVSSFTANWNAVDGAEEYRIDVAHDENFNSYVSGYSNRDAGNNTSIQVSGLQPGNDYYYRVRARRTSGGSVTSSNSNIINARTIGVDPDLSSVEVSEEIVQANDSNTSAVEVTIRDENGNTLPNVDVTLVAKSGNLRADDPTKSTDSNGVVVFQVRNNRAETVTYAAQAGGEEITETVDVTYIPIDPDESLVERSNEKIMANGRAEATITVTARDEFGNPFSNLEIELLQGDGNSTIIADDDVTDSEGKAEFRVRNQTPEVVEYAAQGLGITISQTVVVNFVTVDPGESSVSVSPVEVQANGEEESTITVITRDEDGDILKGAEVELQPTGGSSSVNEVQPVSDDDGEAIFTVTNGIPEIVTYRVVAENIELEQQPEVRFIPVAPVALTATEVQTRRFTSNWEMVNGAETYLLDVATDSSFTSMVGGYEGRDVGNVTSYTVDGLDPGTDYVYRVRVSASGLIGANSQVIGTTTFPDVPNATQASEPNALHFMANWEEAEGARRYRLDVADDPNFDTFVDGYHNRDVGSDLSHQVTGLLPNSTYYYRVRSEAGPRTSGNSNTIEASTLRISSEQSEVSSSQLRVLANGDQPNIITIVVRSDEGVLLEGLEVILELENGSADIDPVQPVTDEEGQAVFEITSTTAGNVNFSVVAATIPVGEIDIEFLQDDGRLDLGQSYPNPFRNQATIPLTVPRPMHISLTVYNSLGMPVQTLKDEQMETGYYEIPFVPSGLAAGVYFYRLVTDDETVTHKMVLVK